MYARPKPGETEEDILRLQEIFLKDKAGNKVKVAATVVSEKRENDNKLEESVENDVQEQLANTFEAVPRDINIGTVIAKESNIRPISKFKFEKGQGFPKAIRRDPSVVPRAGSIFSQQIKRMKKDDTSMEIDQIRVLQQTLTIKENVASSSTTKSFNLPSKSYIVSGEDSQSIHKENIEILKNLSEKDIVEEKNKLIETLDPAILAYLKSKRTKEKVENRNPTIQEQNEAADDIKVEEIEEPMRLLTQPKSEKWLNFDTFESGKLAWMKDIDIPKIDKSKLFEARFDFEGWLLPYANSEINEQNRILYHHGDEAGRPGYTLQELFQLSRSNVIQQKIIALNSIANILAINSTGVYNNIIDIPLEQIFFVLRFCLDDNTPAVLNCSIKAMRNLIYFQIDETCLDSLLGFGYGHIQPTLAIDNSNEDDYTVNDQQLAENNLVKCLARTEILTRIRYIINTVKPSIETLVYCMDILVRLARDSEFILNKILNCDGLIESIITHFLPKVHTAKTENSAYGLPLMQSIKFLRILASRSKNIALQLINKYKVMDSLLLYLSSDSFSSNTNGLRLQIECFHLWSTFVKYNLAVEYFSILEPIVYKLLEYHFHNTNLEMETTFVRQGNLASLLVFLGNVAINNCSLIARFLPLLFEQCFSKWVTQFSNLTDFACGKLQIISALFYSFYCIRMSQPGINPFYEKVDNDLIKLIKSNGFKNVTDHTQNGSMLLNNYETYKCSTNLKTIEASAWFTSEHVVPIVQTKSCIPFLCCLSYYISLSENRNTKLEFLKTENIQKYITSLKSSHQHYLTSNWFTRTESFLVSNILKISVSVQENVDTSTFYELAVRCLCTFNSEQKEDIEFLLENIVFCKKFYPSDVLIKNLNIESRSDSIETSLQNLEEILEVYTQVLALKINIPDFTTNLCLDITIGNVIPIDWIYTPIIVLYANQEENSDSTNEEQQIYVIKNCLRWILIYESYFPFLAESINPTDRFCRLACVFLGSDSLFLSTEIHKLLELCFKNVIRFENELDFKKEIQGLSNFQDFYTQLLEQYQGVSYGDTLFGNVILVPLAQKHLKQLKKTLWSEYMAVVQTFNVTQEQLLSSLEIYFQPPEDDMSLITSYRSALLSNSIRKHSVLYSIASHHVKEFIIRQKNVQS